MKTHARRGEAGFSFVELLVTIIIAGIAFAAMVPLFVQAAATRLGGQHAQPSRSTSPRTSSRRSGTLDYDEIRADAADQTSVPNLYNPGFAGGVFGPEVQTQVGSSFKTFTVEYAVTEVRPTGSTSNAVAYKEVVVTVSWTGKGAASSRRVALRTNIDRQDSGPQITNLAVTPLTSDVVHEGSYILTSALTTTPVTLTATIAPADRTRVGRVEFRVDGVSGVGTFAQTVGFDSSNAQHVNGEFTWVWDAPRNIADGTYTFSAIAYSGALLITPTPPPSPSPSMGIVSGQPGNVWQVMYPLDAGAPGAVALSRVEGAGAVGLSWTAPTDTDIQRLDIYRRETGGEWPADPLHSADPALRYYIDESVVNGTSYDYRVQAVDDFELHGPFSNEVSAQPHLPSTDDDTTAPTTPTALEVAAQGPDVRLLWTAASDPAGPPGQPVSGIWAYRVYRDGAPIATVGAAQTSYIDHARMVEARHSTASLHWTAHSTRRRRAGASPPPPAIP